MTAPIHIGARREVFWDDYLIDTARTTASLQLHRPQAREVVMDHDAEWEGDGCDYHSIVRDGDLYRMYYLGWETMDPEATEHVPRPIVVCYAESRDGRTWVKPDLGICEFNGSTHNNIILDENTQAFDNFSVFKDTCPDCPDSERYKGVASSGGDGALWCFTGADGIHFRRAWRMTDKGQFDTLNVALWDRHSGQYFCYIRDFHGGAPDAAMNDRIRDIRWMVSRDFHTWTTPVLLDFGAGEDYPLYTNVVQAYYRADHVSVGFPSRYVEKRQWSSNFEQMGGAEGRRKRMGVQPRYGLTITDCVFMCSRDGKRWRRWDEAFMTPGMEHKYNWVYGDCYPALGMIETESDLPHAPRELSLYAFDYHWAMRPTQLRRYTIRVDGFVSRRATYAPCMVVTKPFVFTGESLSINFATSAAGYGRIRLLGADTTLESIELFGDSLDRLVEFQTGEVAALAGSPVTMEITMSDADIYSFQFGVQVQTSRPGRVSADGAPEQLIESSQNGDHHE
jgi:hypothetical protein